jgi:restriction system protein
MDHDPTAENGMAKLVQVVPLPRTVVATSSMPIAVDTLAATITGQANMVLESAVLSAQGTVEPPPPPPLEYPELLLKAEIVVTGDKTAEGKLISDVSIFWFDIVKQLQRDPQFLFKVDWRRLEELIAGAYKQAGYPDVTLTPRSGDRGRDVIASKPGFGAIRIVDQVKRYAPRHRVTANEVRSIFGVFAADLNVSKGVITTTATFAPGALTKSGLDKYVPYRLELKDGPQLVQWLISLLPKPGS